jgi:putative ABC transport system ATP-binding protein
VAAGTSLIRLRTVLMVTHEPDMAAYARRLVRFVDGRIDSEAPNPHPVGLDLPPPAPTPLEARH